MTTYFDPLKIGDLELSNRIWMPALTRARATADGMPVEVMAEYYRQRATAGLIISEGTYVNADTCGFEMVPGLFNAAQIEAWKPITDAVHDEGGQIFCQLWHCGRIGAAGILGGREPLSPSGINDDLAMLDVYGLLANGNYAKLAATPSRAMSTDEVARTVDDFGKAASNAKAAGFDGVEIHAANGYLPHQFLSPVLNTREDAYGGSMENRARFVMEVFEAAAAELSAGRVGVRVSPYAAYNNTRIEDKHAVFSDLAARLDRAGAGYLHFADMNGWFGYPDLDKILEALRPNFSGPIIANGGITVEQGADLLATGQVQAVAFGRAFLANPDLVTRIAKNAPITDPRPVGWYAAGALGYTDYPAMV